MPEADNEGLAGLDKAIAIFPAMMGPARGHPHQPEPEAGSPAQQKQQKRVIGFLFRHWRDASTLLLFQAPAYKD